MSSSVKTIAGAVQRVDVNSIRPHPNNPNRGDVEAITESLRVNGQFRPIVVQQSTGFILAGNHTYLAALSLGWTELDAWVVDVDDRTATRILLADNRTAQLAVIDDAELLAVLRSLDGDLVGTGYTDVDIDNLVALLSDDTWTPGDGKPAKEPGEEDFWPKIQLQVPPEVFDAWRAALDRYDGKDDVAKLTALLQDGGQLK